MVMLISFSQLDFGPAHSAKTTSSWFADHGITVLDWPANLPDSHRESEPHRESIGYYQEEDERHHIQKYR